MPLRNGEEISVTKKRKFRICELEITYNFKVLFTKLRLGYPYNTKEKMPKDGAKSMKTIQRLQLEKKAESKKVGFFVQSYFCHY